MRKKERKFALKCNESLVHPNAAWSRRPTCPGRPQRGEATSTHARHGWYTHGSVPATVRVLAAVYVDAVLHAHSVELCHYHQAARVHRCVPVLCTWTVISDTTLGLMGLLPLLASVLPLGSFHPYYTQPIANSIQRWDISTLRKQIHAGHVRRVAIYQDSSIVEVLDQNGLQRRIDVFPPAASLLVKDLHEEHVEFFVAPVKQPSLLVPFDRAFVLTLLVIFLIDALGMLPRHSCSAA